MQEWRSFFPSFIQVAHVPFGPTLNQVDDKKDQHRKNEAGIHAQLRGAQGYAKVERKRQHQHECGRRQQRHEEKDGARSSTKFTMNKKKRLLCFF